ncbi:MAG: TonB-dependent receptor, partial [Gammaproteobacteria bacterium]|nr:TonB-dependent receptor [Gammaproteobacteria bacterium]
MDTGAGPVIVDVPGANSIVKEERWDFLLQDTWFQGDFELDYGLGAETSTITQTGDADQKRSFFFLKPQGILKYAPEQGQQTRL